MWQTEIYAFSRRLLVLSLPFWLVFAGVAMIDPYDFVSQNASIDRSEKEYIAFHLNYTLWKYLRYQEAPIERILLGDSRMEGLTEEQMLRITGKPYFNFAFGGGTVPEMIETFWYATKHTKLESVSFGINFGRYNAFNNDNRCREAKELIAHKHRYFIHPSVLKSCFYILKDQMSGSQTQLTKPMMDKEAFWKHQLGFLAQTFYRDYAYPEEYYQQLQEVVEYCKEQGIDYQFIILPTHVELQEQILVYKQEEAYARFRQDLENLGPVHDFHQADSLTLNKDLYKDPFHFGPKVGDQVIKQVFGQK
ncbi:MAG: hypothetical protein AAFQ68_17850 [Bacteroidota bacterium]